MKKMLCLFLAILLLMTSAVGCGKKTESEAVKPEGNNSEAQPLKVAIMIENVFGTQSFVDVALKGCDRAVEEFGIEL